MQFINQGPGKAWVRFSVKLFWPVIIAGKRCSNTPVLKWLIRPFFMRPHNEITSIPINVDVQSPESVALPRRLVERLVADVEEKFILDECICRGHNRVDTPPRTIGCMALGPAIRRIHPSHGRMVTTEEAIRHVDRAARAGLVANFAHVWIDPVAFGTRFRDLMFICFCDDKNCIYRTHMKSRGPTLNGAYQKLPGFTISVDKSKCTGCGECIEQCFLANMSLVDEKSYIGESCAGCGRCVDACSNHAVILKIEGEDAMYANLVRWINGVSELPIKKA